MTDHVDLLRRTVRDVAADVAAEYLAENPEAAPAVLWHRLTELGVAELTGAGGDAGTIADLLEVLWELAAADVSVPFLETCVVGRWVVERARLPVPEGMLAVTGWNDLGRVRWIGESDAVVVVDAAEARIAVVESDGHLTGRDVDGVGWGPLLGEKLNDPRAWTALDGLVIEELEVRMAVATACSLVGAMESAVDLGRVHASTRFQFRRPVLEFQAVRHALVAAHAEAHVAGLAVRRAIGVVEDQRVARREVAAALVRAADAASEVARTVHQVHGALGLTEEHALWRRTMRLWALRETHVNTEEWAQELGADMLAAQDPWVLITQGDVRNCPGAD